MRCALPLALARPYPLFAAYPALRDQLAREPLAEDRTPVHALKRLLAGNIWIKRDDQCSFLYGGTKIRKIEFLMGEARAAEKSRIVALGAAGSHFLLASAVCAKRLGIELEAVICDQPMATAARQNLLALFDQSATLRYGGSQWRAAAYFGSRLLRRKKTEYFLPAGGSSPLGTVGVVNAAFELKAQIESGMMPPPAMVVCALGSGGTLAGLALGAQLAGLESEVVGVRVYPERIGPLPTATAGRVCRLMKNTLRLLRHLSPNIPNLRIHVPRILGNYIGRGYAIPNPSGETAKRRLAESEGIQLESTYTAKTFAAVLDLRRNLSDPAPVLYWHSFSGEFAKCKLKLSEYRRLPRALHSLFEQPPSQSRER